MTIETLKFSQMTDAGNIQSGNQFPGILSGGNVLFDYPTPIAAIASPITVILNSIYYVASASQVVFNLPA